MKINRESVRMLELELTGTCNLSCPLCVRSNPKFDSVVSKNLRPLDEIIKQLDSFPNITDVCVAGIMSEPTHYPDLVPLLMYLEKRGIQVELYINGNTHTSIWWYNLGQNLKCTKVIFTVCGSTQEIHEQYRVGSNLEQIYRNAEAFRGSGNVNDYLQVIKFNYNEVDINNNYDNITKGFNNVLLINSLHYQERFGVDCDIKMPENLSEMYHRLHTQMKSRYRNDNVEVTCNSYDTSFISIDQYGRLFPCFLYRLYTLDVFDLDYTDILNKKYDFCFECNKLSKKLLSVNNLDRMI